MAKHGKKHLQAKEALGADKLTAEQAFAKIKELAHAKFDESVDVDINLSIDPTKGDQTVRGSVMLPHGRGKEPKVIVFAKGDQVDAAKAAGADLVGDQDLIDKISKGWMDFDYAVATPDMMALVGRLAKILGPRGLLPNKKLGTVTTDVGQIVSELKKGRVFFKNDKQGLVHFSLGKVSFDPSKLQDNLSAFVKALVIAKPPVSKGKFLKKMTLSSTMGIGIRINPDEVA